MLAKLVAAYLLRMRYLDVPKNALPALTCGVARTRKTKPMAQQRGWW